MEQATLTIRLWTESADYGEVSKTLPDELGEIAMLMSVHLQEIKSKCDQGYVAGKIIDEDFAGWWELKGE